MSEINVTPFVDVMLVLLIVFMITAPLLKTGVEIESLFATEVALLTVYDMCKYIDKSMTISGIKLLKKTGGKSGDFIR